MEIISFGTYCTFAVLLLFCDFLVLYVVLKVGLEVNIVICPLTNFLKLYIQKIGYPQS